ncbi:hypothetical protein E2C01_074578 [Portunus trituberculatus]|uniref:Uncharacterized protein n=1 Tax=Portunus trituberculatus TaxID=210409 RepID=A0A5B7ICU5_PORTR|nr:hypothetical protein [Portunus trituberculatus]
MYKPALIHAVMYRRRRFAPIWPRLTNTSSDKDSDDTEGRRSECLAGIRLREIQPANPRTLLYTCFCNILIPFYLNLLIRLMIYCE